MILAVQRLGSAFLNWLTLLGGFALFFMAILRSLPAALRRHSLVVDELYRQGNRSLSLILAAGLTVGLILALQLFHTLSLYGATENLGLVVNLSLVRELGPVVTALLFAGRAGTALTAEIGLMKYSDELTAMEVMAVSPYRRILAPRLLAGVMVMPLLAVLFSTTGILGAYLIAVGPLGIDPGNFWSAQQASVYLWQDIGSGVLKSFAFGVLVTSIALYHGYRSQPSPAGVAAATTRGVIVASLAVLTADFILTALLRVVT
ncbi:lipid asymmetry maintenance ABC transporter permease subunit MlaE [Pseudomonas oryzihabitans]|uniref:lipid asymmetry maintenance ABC transporter permease subunit MlaE n=1 Tax=Pseudomonas oryzihabitans TaxID=47885 RepID=UPI00135E728F|nr:lipid asymmetry maintenance ABC transporter permease subunit MlaE [Pseudomonas oryzihabitans]MXS21558.1 lipid asymmetry maintenance ABC transporter permease subunit MlaE [Pseudomonas oryzihabitans]